MMIAQKVHRLIQAEALLSRGERVLVATSGGADSVALAHILAELGFSIELAHFDHQTREGESALDRQFVRDLAGQMGAPFHTATKPVAVEAAAAGESFETCARRLRYGWLLAMARERDCAAVATGHHADDQAETVLMRLLRGTGPFGLAGIPPMRLAEGVRIVRPLLQCRRVELEEYLRLQHKPWRTDSTNADTDFLRNRIRHELLPHLRSQYNPQVEDALARFADNVRVENALIDYLAAAALNRCLPTPEQINRAAFRNEHPALQRRILGRFIEDSGCPATHACVVEGVQFVRSAATGSHFDAGAGFLLHAGRHTVRVVRRGLDETKPAAFPAPGEAVFLHHRFMSRLLPEPPSEALRSYCSAERQVLDWQSVAPPLSLRTWQDGDRFKPLGLGGTRKLQDYFVDAGIEAPLRRQIPLLVDTQGILWVVGHAIDARAAVRDHTRQLLEVTVAACT